MISEKENKQKIPKGSPSIWAKLTFILGPAHIPIKTIGVLLQGHTVKVNGREET